jgi:hypothetical protein
MTVGLSNLLRACQAGAEPKKGKPGGGCADAVIECRCPWLLWFNRYRSACAKKRSNFRYTPKATGGREDADPTRRANT